MTVHTERINREMVSYLIFCLSIVTSTGTSKQLRDSNVGNTRRKPTRSQLITVAILFSQRKDPDSSLQTFLLAPTCLVLIMRNGRSLVQRFFYARTFHHTQGQLTHKDSPTGSSLNNEAVSFSGRIITGTVVSCSVVLDGKLHAIATTLTINIFSYEMTFAHL